MKKILVLNIFFFVLFFSIDAQAALFEECAFCDPDVLERQVFYEDDLVLALYTHKPIFPGHCLIIPKRHVERFEQLADLEVARMGEVIKRVNTAVREVFETSAYLLLQKNGYEVGQTVPHVHFHYVPRREGDDSVVKYIWKMFTANLGFPISKEEMEYQVMRLERAIAKNP